ncbi:hypothetical protein Q5762_32610 [Streptomyces sp. P9(2023)]|uniref:hypothetical protein n=1 Tax=Streptomyces sp. P9(2023) TaxID=3064394 RepID=UPI0028F45302|nr:hypothetical protein [Streptomyces sp. P9(2023)]MDT9692982.1 hypothetical protein [Streptomyces sp. P9(2023)]
MINRRTIGVAAATALLGGLGAYGAATAFASPSATDPQPTPSATASTNSTHDGMDRDEMIRHCTDQLPAGERAKARQQMEKMMPADMDGMMSGSMTGGGMDGMMSGSMTGGASTDGHHGMG